MSSLAVPVQYDQDGDNGGCRFDATGTRHGMIGKRRDVRADVRRLYAPYERFS